MKIKSIWYEFDEWKMTDTFNREDSNTDVIFELDNDSKWVVSFFTYKNIKTLQEKNKSTGEHLNGTYFCSTDMVLISFISKELILEVINEMISRNELELYCTRL